MRTHVVQAAGLHGALLATWGIFEGVRLRDDRFRRALESFDATYQFRFDSTVGRLVFSGGRVRFRPGEAPSPECEVVLIDPVGALRLMRREPGNMLQLLLENKIDHRGNQFYLFKFGFLLGLCRRHVTESLRAVPGLRA